MKQDLFELDFYFCANTNNIYYSSNLSSFLNTKSFHYTIYYTIFAKNDDF